MSAIPVRVQREGVSLLRPNFSDGIKDRKNTSDRMLSAKRGFGVRPICMTSLANPMALKTKKTPRKKRRNDLGERVFQKVLSLLIRNAARCTLYFSNSDAQFRMIDKGAAFVSSILVLIRNFWPSLDTS